MTYCNFYIITIEVPYYTLKGNLKMIINGIL